MIPKWVAIDADYGNAVEDLLNLQWELRQDGVDAALEKSRRGGHLWIFAEQPLLARDCRVYIYNLATRLKVPVKGGARLAEGIEVFPRQDRLGSAEFGNALRGPLGVHRTVGQRFWFYGADYQLEAQLDYLERLKKITEAEMSCFVKGLSMPEEFQPKPKIVLPPYDPTRREFRILDHVVLCNVVQETTGFVAHRAPSRAATEVATIWPSALPIRGSTSVGQVARRR